MAFKIVLKGDIPDNAVFVTGFQGIGITGYIAIRHLISSLKAKPLGFILLDKMPPFVWMEEDRLATPIQIFSYDRYVFLMVEFLPSPPEVYKLITKICEWVVGTQKFSEALLIGGLDLRVKKEGEKEDLKFAATTCATKKVLERGYKVLDRGLFVTGPLALMLMGFEALDFPALAILAYANSARPDPMAAAVAIRCFSEMYGVKVDVEELIKDAQKIEAEVEESLKKRQERLRAESLTLYI
ncbi:MAG: hypothetical protein DRJ37_05370 [Thermoprotei archaeon]|nr:MAG: hypothetical protein DRJ37_05370 [Thermoprotei archaeon]RLF22114.1 MAG: hypothetical protein DRJ68_01975 [Thermoprotei archaeon]